MTPARKDLMFDAEGVAAMQTLIVVKDFFIHLFANRGSSYPTSYSAK